MRTGTHGVPVAPGPGGTPLPPVFVPVRTAPPAAKTAGATTEKSNSSVAATEAKDNRQETLSRNFQPKPHYHRERACRANFPLRRDKGA
jgi:hypothetical protein